MKSFSITREVVETKRLVLRPYVANDYATWFDAYVNRLPAQNKFDFGPKPKETCSRAEFRKLRARHQNLAKDDAVYIYGVFERTTGILVGAIDIATMVRGQTQMANQALPRKRGIASTLSSRG